MRRATQGDLAEMEGFLRADLHRSMFPLANLADHGLDGEAPRSVHAWLRHGEAGVTDVLSITREGMVMPQCPTGGWEQAARALSRRTLIGFAGPAVQVHPLREALGLEGAPVLLDADEPQYLMDLAGLEVPEGPGTLVPLAEAPRGTVIDWLEAYRVEALGAAPDSARAEAEKVYDVFAAQGSHVVLMEGATPLALTGFNARLPEIVQIGGVYTPPELRGRHHARRAVALHLAEARERGVMQATLFASGPAACRSYESLGFRRTGEWTLCLYTEPQHV